MTISLSFWTEDHREGFRRLHADPDVMADLGGPISLEASDAKFNRYRDGWSTDGTSRWAVTQEDGQFIGYAGIVYRKNPDHPLGLHHEIGWRFHRDAWGKGYATEAARKALAHAWTTLPISKIFSYTAPDNFRSQSVMARLNLRRIDGLDFTAGYPEGDWSGLVWIADRPALAE
jgi:RimJ/RimL family protein N-acetyltransferase